MAEKRKPTYVFLLKNMSITTNRYSTNKVEVFPAKCWKKERSGRQTYDRLFRLRVNGKWYPKGKMKFFYKTEIRDLMWKSINFPDYYKSKTPAMVQV